jgi:GT2 family glycosyltransferase
MNEPLISLISVNYAQTEATAEMIESVLAGDYPRLEIIIVDNGSAGAEVDGLHDRFPMIRLIKSPVNLGYAGGCNLGLRNANGDYFFFLNNDVVVAPDAIRRLATVLNEHPRTGLVSPKIRFYHHDDVLQFAGYTEMSHITLRNRAIGYLEKDTGQFDEPRITPFAHGAAMMARADMIRQVGLLSEVFFLYYEEMDWCSRIRRAGYQIRYESQAVIWHKESLSAGRASPLKIYFLNRNRVLYLLRNLQGWEKQAAWWYQNLVVFPKKIVSLYLRLHLANGRALLKAWKWVWKNHRNPEIYQNLWL